MANNKFSDSIDETAYQALEDALQLGAYENQPEPRRRSTPKPAEARVPEQNRPRKNDQQAQSFLFSFGSRSWRSGFQALLECCFQVFRLAILAQ